MTEPHLHDELLSASLDGEVDPATIEHLAGCTACLARLDVLDAVRDAVAAVPDPAPAQLTDRALAAATQAWREELARDVVVPLRPAAAPAPLGPATAAGGGRRRPTPDDITPRRAGRGRRVPGWALGAAAAVVALLVAVPIVLRDPDPDQRTASAPTDEAAGLADADAVDGGELGALTDPATLREQLQAAVPGAGAGGETEARAAPSTGDSLAASPAPAEATSAPEAADTGAATPQAARSADPTACRTEVRASYGTGLGELLYTASLRWQGTDSVLLAYRLADTAGAGPDFRAFVMARDGCRLLVVQGF